MNSLKQIFAIVKPRLRFLLTYYRTLFIKYSHDVGNVVANINLDHLPDVLIMNVKSPSVCGKRQNDLSIRTQID